MSAGKYVGGTLASKPHTDCNSFLFYEHTNILFDDCNSFLFYEHTNILFDKTAEIIGTNTSKKLTTKQIL